MSTLEHALAGVIVRTLGNTTGADLGPVCTDSRQVRQGSVFVALKGERFDGHDYAAQAARDGASVVVVERDTGASCPQIIVRDTQEALGALARAWRSQFAVPVICVVGSNGKTTTTQMIASILRSFVGESRVVATEKNYNNHIGVPLTLLAMTRDVEFGIVEMGASACGEIALLCSIAEPNYGIVTNIGRAHLEGFGGPEGVRRGKGELYDWLARTGGRVFVPANDPVLMSMAAERETLAAECYPTTLADGVEHHLEGDYNRFNVAAAVAVGRYFGVDDERIRYAVGSYRPDNHRSQKIRTGQNTLILDCYNANPSSMQASLVNFRQEPLEGCTRKILILGDMLELGDWSDAEHRHIISLAAEIPDARILLVGPHFAKAYRSLESRPADTTLYPSQEVLAAELRKHPVSQALILVKGSHSIGLERLADLL